MFKFGEHLKSLREQNNLTQKQISSLLNIDRSTYSYYELCKTQPNIQVLKKIARIYNVSLDYLLGNDINKTDENFILCEDGDDYNAPNIDKLSDLSKDEKNLIIYYRQLSSKEKERVYNYCKNTYISNVEKKGEF